MTTFMVLAAAVISQAAPSWMQVGVQPAPAEAAELAEACGAGRPDVASDEDLQEDVLRFSSGSPFPDEVLQCLARVSYDTGYTIDVPETYWPKYYEFTREIAEPWSLDLAKAWLTENGLLANLPIRASGESDEAFAVRLEKHCGSDAAGALSSKFGPHSIDPETILRMQGTERQAAVLMCLSSLATLAEYPLYMMGNEAPSPAE